MIIDRHLITRKLGSLISRASQYKATLTCRLLSILNPKIQISPACKFGHRAILRATDGGSIKLGARTSIGCNAQIIAQAGHVVIGEDVHIGDGVIITCRESIHIGTDSLIAEYVVIRDQDHETHTRPIRLAGFRTAPIRIGRDVWIGCKASILRGVNVGDGAVVGAHALVRSYVPAGQLAVGVPARVVGPVGGAA